MREMCAVAPDDPHTTNLQCEDDSSMEHAKREPPNEVCEKGVERARRSMRDRW